MLKISIAILLYNQHEFIAQAIESVLAQQLPFECEVIVADDCSQDDSLEIVRMYAARNPEVRILAQPVNVGYQQNLSDLLRACSGEYIALLEGDDYWCDITKLAQQIKFLDEHLDCSLCHHNVRVLKESSGETWLYRRYSIPPVTQLSDWLAANYHIATCSLVFRRSCLNVIPSWFQSVHLADVALCTLLGEHGTIGHIDQVLGVYRIHAGGVWSGGSTFSELPRAVLERKIQRQIETYETINRHLNYSHDRILRERASELWYDLVWRAQCELNMSEMRRYLSSAFACKLFNPRTPKKYVLKAWMNAYFPFVTRVARRLRGMTVMQHS